MDCTYLGVIYASFELGLKIVILSKPINTEQASKPKATAHFPLDVLIINKEKFTNSFLNNFLRNNSKIIINTDNIQYVEPSQQIDYTPDPDNICLLCTSSGSTDNPKLLSHSHKFFYELCSTNYQPLGFTPDDRVLHLIAINHGSALGVYFLPSMHICKNHYFMIRYFIVNSSEEENWDKWIEFCIENKITKVHSPHSIETNNMISAIRRSKVGLPDLTIMILSFINPEWLSVVKEGKLKGIVSIFGCSEASGPLFLSSVDKNTENFDPKFFGNPIQDFHLITVDEKGELTVNIPTYNTTIKTEDFFERTDSGYRFISKNKLYRIGDTEINVSDIQLILQKNLEKTIIDDIIILVDEIYSKLYVITTNKEILFHEEKLKEEIESYYENSVMLNNFILVDSFEEFIVGIKPDRDKLLTYVRQMEITN